MLIPTVGAKKPYYIGVGFVVGGWEIGATLEFHLVCSCYSRFRFIKALTWRALEWNSRKASISEFLLRASIRRLL